MDRSNENRGIAKPWNFRVLEMMNSRALRILITFFRRFFAFSANKSQHCHQKATGDKRGVIGNEKHKDSYVTYTGGSSGNAIDVELPIVEESALDIDICDYKNPLAVVEYVEDIYNNYKGVEVIVGPYMSFQSEINENMRASLIDWLIGVHYKFELMDETLYLTVNVVDRFLSKKKVVGKKLQLVGATAMLMACKYEEVSCPGIEHYIQISDRAYTREEILEMEKLMVDTVQFNLSVPTPYVFMRRFLKAADSDKKLEFLSYFIIELCLIEHRMLKFQPSLLAAAAIYTAQCSVKGFKYWTKTCEQYTAYTEDQLLECSRMMVNFHRKAGRRRGLTRVHRKYSSLKFGRVAKSEPALFLL